MSVKKDYLHKLDVELEEWDDKISKLEAQVEKATPEERVELTDHIERLKTKLKLARKKHEELENAHESVWEGLRDGIDSIFENMIRYTNQLCLSSKIRNTQLATPRTGKRRGQGPTQTKY